MASKKKLKGEATEVAFLEAFWKVGEVKRKSKEQSRCSEKEEWPCSSMEFGNGEQEPTVTAGRSKFGSLWAAFPLIPYAQ